MGKGLIIPLVLILSPPLGLIVGAVIGDQISLISTQSGITDGYEAGGVLGFKIGLICAFIVVAINIRNDMKKNDLRN